MKTKSKLVLGLSILSAAAMAAGATSTFAWYTTTVQGSVAAKSATQSPVTSKVVPTALSDTFALKLTINRVTGLGTATDPGVNSEMELTHYATSNQPTIDDTLVGQEDGFFFGYYIGSTPHYRTNQISTNAEYWRLYSVKVELDVNGTSGKAKKSNGDDSLYTKAEALAYLAEATTSNGFGLKVERDDAAHYYQSTDQAPVAGKTYYSLSNDEYTAIVNPNGDMRSNYEKYVERAFFGSEASNSAAPTAAYADGTSGGVVFASNQKVVSDGSTFYFGMYIEGDGVQEKELVGGHFKVTATVADVNYIAD